MYHDLHLFVEHYYQTNRSWTGQVLKDQLIWFPFLGHATLHVLSWSLKGLMTKLYMSVFTLTGQTHSHTHTNTITIVHGCPQQCHHCVWKSVVNKSVGHQPTVLNQHWSGCFIRESYDSAQITNLTISWIIYSHPFDGVCSFRSKPPYRPMTQSTEEEHGTLVFATLVAGLKNENGRYPYHGQIK